MLEEKVEEQEAAEVMPIVEMIAEETSNQEVRIQEEYREVMENPINDVKIISPLVKANKEIVLLVKGPEYTPYENGVFRVVLGFSPQYPKVVPTCIFKTKIWHP